MKAPEEQTVLNCRAQRATGDADERIAAVLRARQPSTGTATVEVMPAAEPDKGELDEQDRRVLRREREVELREQAVAAREAAADAREIALEMRETSVEMQASAVDQHETRVDQRDTWADQRDMWADQRETRADQREQLADERDAEFSRLHPPTADVAAELGQEGLDRALAQLRRSEDAVDRARTHLARAEHNTGVAR